MPGSTVSVFSEPGDYEAASQNAARSGSLKYVREKLKKGCYRVYCT
jgi:hypothetical protein